MVGTARGAFAHTTKGHLHSPHHHPLLRPQRRDRQQAGTGDRPACHRGPLQQRRIFRQLLQAAGDRRHPREGRQRQRREHQPHHLAFRPLSPIAKAAATALISMQPHAAPAMNCAAISMLRLPANSAPITANAPSRPAAPITINPPRCLTITLAGNIAILKPIQNTGISHGRSSGLANRRKNGVLLMLKCSW